MQAGMQAGMIDLCFCTKTVALKAVTPVHA